MPFTVISYYTDNYKPYNDRLTASCERFKLPIVSRRVKNRGSWHQSTAYKPQFILDMLHELNTDILYMDADSEFMAAPKLFNCRMTDIAIHKWSPQTFATGTIYLSNRPMVHEFVTAWRDIMSEVGIDDPCPDQESFYRAWRLCDQIGIMGLPPEYCWIDIASRREYGKRDPVIFHHQASRMHRNHGWAELDNDGIARLAANIDQAGEM